MGSQFDVVLIKVNTRTVKKSQVENRVVESRIKKSRRRSETKESWVLLEHPSSNPFDTFYLNCGYVFSSSAAFSVSYPLLSLMEPLLIFSQCSRCKRSAELVPAL